MPDAMSERGRPIMEYVHSLENQVRNYRRAELRFNARCFGFGLGWGAGVVGLAWALVAWLRG